MDVWFPTLEIHVARLKEVSCSKITWKKKNPIVYVHVTKKNHHSNTFMRKTMKWNYIDTYMIKIFNYKKCSS